MLKINKQLNTISLNYTITIAIAFLFAILSLALLKVSWYIILVPLFLIPILLYGEKIFVFYSIISFLSLTSTISIELRTIVQIIAILLLVYLFIKEYGFNFSEYPKIPKKVSLLILLLYTAMIISTIFSNYILLGFKEIFRLTIFLAIVYVFFSYLKRSKDINLFLMAFFITGIIYFANVFFNFAQNNFSLVELNINELLKVEGNYINVNSIGSFFVIIISLLLSYFFAFKDKKRKIFLASFLFVFFLGLIITNSRAAILSTVISSIFLIYFFNKKIFYSIIAAVIILIPFLFIQPISSYIDLYFRLDKLTTGRNWIWDTVISIIKDNPILGAGPAATKFAMYKDLPFMLGSTAEQYISLHINQIEFGHAHNFYLFFLTDLGILGLFTALFLPYVFISLSVKTIKKFKNNSTEYYCLTMGITAAGIGLFIRGLFEWGNLISYGTLESDLPFWLIFIILIYLYQVSGTEIIQNKSLS